MKIVNNEFNSFMTAQGDFDAPDFMFRKKPILLNGPLSKG